MIPYVLHSLLIRSPTCCVDEKKLTLFETYSTIDRCIAWRSEIFSIARMDIKMAQLLRGSIGTIVT